MARGGPELLEDPIAQELLTSPVPARLAYVWMDGTPRVVPIWFHWSGSEIVMGTFIAFSEGTPPAPKTKAIKSGDRVALTIDIDGDVTRALSIRGTAEVSEVNGIVPEYAEAAIRYLGREAADEYLASMSPALKMARIAVRPDAVVLLDFDTRFPSAMS